jgi:hypothetical protein
VTYVVDTAAAIYYPPLLWCKRTGLHPTLCRLERQSTIRIGKECEEDASGREVNSRGRNSSGRSSRSAGSHDVDHSIKTCFGFQSEVDPAKKNLT